MTKTVNVTTILIEASKLPSIAQKLLLLEKISTHPITNYLVDGIGEIMNYYMSNGKNNQKEMLDTVNLYLVTAANKFQK